MPHKQFYTQIPPLRKKIPSYNIKDEYAIILPLFFTKKSREYFDSLKTDSARLTIEGFAKRSLWLMFELIHYTDIQEYCVPVFIIATEEMHEMLRPYIITDNILIAENIKDYAYLTKLFIMQKAASIIPAEKIIMLDISHHVRAKPENIKYPFIHNLQDWTTEDFAHKGEYYIPFQYDHEQAGTPDKALNRFNTDGITEKEYYRKAADYVDVSIKEYKQFWYGETARPYVFGSGHGITRNMLLSKEFKTSLHTISEFTGNDETFIELFMQKHFTLSGNKFKNHIFTTGFTHDTWEAQTDRNTWHINAGNSETEHPEVFSSILNNMQEINANG